MSRLEHGMRSQPVRVWGFFSAPSLSRLFLVSLMSDRDDTVQLGG